MSTFLMDDYNDNSIDGNLWSTSGVGVSESSSRVNLVQAANGSRSGIYGKRYYNLREGILAGQLVAKSGTTHSQVLIGVGVKDPSFNYWQINGQSSSATFSREFSGVSSGTITIVDTTVGYGPTLTLGSWLGYTYNSGDSTIRLMKSTDGVNWTQLHRNQTTGGAMVWGDIAIYFEVINNSGGISNFNVSFDNPTYFATDSFLASRCRVAGAWDLAVPKVRVGGLWVPARSKNRVGGAWVDPN